MPVKTTFALDDDEFAYLKHRSAELGVPVTSVVRAMIRDLQWLDERAPDDGSVVLRKGGLETEVAVGSLRNRTTKSDAGPD